jgi:2-polyprenyl-3-methyl-5-hydroxy-6-metoxy-1,4-benzoquinol methylase
MAEMKDIDVEQLMERIRENVRRRKSVPEHSTSDNVTVPFGDGPAAADLACLHSGYDVRNVPLASPRAGIGPLVVGAKKILRTLFAPVLGTQVVYNAANTRVITQMTEWISRMDRQQTVRLSSVNQTLADLERGQAQLKDKIFEELTRLRQEIRDAQDAQDSRFSQESALVRQEMKDHIFEELTRLGQEIRDAQDSRFSQESALVRQEMTEVHSQLQSRLAGKLDARSPALSLLQERISRAERKVRRIVHALQTGHLQEPPLPQPADEPPAHPLPELDPVLDYVGLAERFRGSEEEIKERQRVYVPYFQGRATVLDIGSGRGEFLEVLAENGIKGRGVELDLDMALLCQDKGLDVVKDDAFHYLTTLADDSVDGVFGAQVIEHLYPPRVIELVRLCYQKLAPGGVLILETPNPKCLTVFAESFYKDPTHIQPLHPDLMQFVFEAAGFDDVEIAPSAPVDAYLRIPALQAPGLDASQFNQAIDRLNSLLFGFQDYAVIGRKGPGVTRSAAAS